MTAPPSQPVVSQRLLWLHTPPFRVGVHTGIYLSAVLLAWLVVANHIPASADFAGVRNLVALGLFAFVMLIPVGRFLVSPAKLFISGVAAWLVVTLVYAILGFLYSRLHTRLGVFHLFVLGVACYGAAAVFSWVVSLVSAAREHPVAVTRRRRHS